MKKLERPLVEVLLAVQNHLLLQCHEPESKLLDLLPRVEGEVVPLLAQPLQRGTADAVDGVPCLLGRELVRERTCISGGTPAMMASSTRQSSWYARSPYSTASQS